MSTTPRPTFTVEMTPAFFVERWYDSLNGLMSSDLIVPGPIAYACRKNLEAAHRFNDKIGRDRQQLMEQYVVVENGQVKLAPREVQVPDANGAMRTETRPMPVFKSERDEAIYRQRIADYFQKTKLRVPVQQVDEEQIRNVERIPLFIIDTLSRGGMFRGQPMETEEPIAAIPGLTVVERNIKQPEPDVEAPNTHNDGIPEPDLLEEQANGTE